MEKLHHIKKDLVCAVYQYLEANEENNFSHVNTCELGQAIDMIKDICEAIYYAEASEAMKNGLLTNPTNIVAK